MNYTDLMEKDKSLIWHPFTQMSDWVREDQTIIESANGHYLYDVKGRRYFDGVSSLWVNIFGHRRKEIDDSIRLQLEKMAHSTFLGLSHVQAIMLAEKLVNITPSALKRVFFSDNGSTAMEIALKMAFQYWRQKEHGKHKERSGFITLTGAYHGDTIGSVSAGGIPVFHEIFSPLLFHTIKMPAPYCYRCHYNLTYPECNLHCAEMIKVMLIREKHRIGAVIIEPMVQGAAGMIVQPAGFLKKIRDATKETETLLIVDEVATGFGRTGKMFAVEHEDVQPDIMALAKGITGGYLPLAATLTTEQVYEAFLGRYEEFKTFFHGHSYTANPLGCAAAIATLNIFEKNDILSHVNRISEYLSKRLNEIKNLPHIGDIRQKGLMVGIELVSENNKKVPFDPTLKVGQKVIKKANEYGVILRPLGDVIVLMPPLTTTIDEINMLCDVTFDAINHVLQSL